MVFHYYTKLNHVLSYGERFDREKHTLGTEIKAVTYSNMQISLTAPFDIYVVVDI
jgi:SHS2 domain-containing protein